MLRSFLVLGFSTLMLAGPALAGSMPVLPHLPPLPTDYESQGAAGPYAGILSGFVNGSDTGLALAVVVGNTFAAADLLLGIEAMGTATTSGEATVEGSLRAGVPLADTINAFGNVGLGYSFDTDAFVSLGMSLEADVGEGWLIRADYRYSHDLSGDGGSHKLLAGLLHTF
jgi:hypothetical protein